MKKLLSVLTLVVMIICVMPLKTQALSAASAVVIGGDTGEIIYSYNANTRLSMASTTKIMTGLILCERGNLDREIIVTAPMVAVEGSSMGLRAGDKISLRDLLYGLMLASGNDAANAIAIALGGTIEGFADMMNEKAAELGLKNTHFVTPSGLDADGHYTTAYELALIAKCALENEEFAKAVSTKNIILSYGTGQHYLSNHNRLLSSVDGVVGVKTGYTKKSGRCLVTAYKNDGKFIICVTLNDPNDWADHKALINIGVSAIEDVVLEPTVDKLEVQLLGGVQKSLLLNFENTSLAMVNSGEITCRINLPEVLYAPLSEGEKIGFVSYYKDGNLILTEDIRAPYDVPQKNYKNSEKLMMLFKQILSAV